MVVGMIEPYDDDNDAYMGEEIPEDYQEPEESEEDYYPEPMYGQ